ncbi:MAG: shikimate dehydrogenase [Cryobacterium sp.]
MSNSPLFGEPGRSLARLPAGPCRLAVIGSPIGHSRSPDLHRAAYRVLGLDWSYEAIDVSAGELARFVSRLSPEWRGLSVTMPLKREALAVCEDRDRVAVLSAAANTLLLSGPAADAPGREDAAGIGRLVHGFNTDVPGLVRALAEAGMTRAHHVTILGAGATAASALVAAAELGTQAIDVLVRTPAKATGLVELGHQLGLLVTVSSLADVAAPGRASDLVISTLPGGTVLDAQFPAELRRRALLFDVAYAPWPSALGRSWTGAGGQIASGLGMLLHQALIQVRVFVTGDPLTPVPQEDAVLDAMRGALSEKPRRPGVRDSP